MFCNSDFLPSYVHFYESSTLWMFSKMLVNISYRYSDYLDAVAELCPNVAVTSDLE